MPTPRAVFAWLGFFVSLSGAVADDVIPGKTWLKRTPGEMGLIGTNLTEAARTAGGRGCVIKAGFLVHTWGDYERSADIASASKVFYSHLLFAAVADKKLSSVDEKVVKFQPCLASLNAALGHKDRSMTFRHLGNQTACLGFTEEPGTAFDYNDSTMGFFWDTLVNKVYEVPWNDADEKLFAPKLAAVLQFEDRFTVKTGKLGRPVISPRDFARFGLLYMRRGKWGGHQVIPVSAVEQMLGEPLPLGLPRTGAKTADQCAGRSIGGGANQTDHSGCYSWLWWLNRPGNDGTLWWPEAPADMFTALGHCGQRGLAVFPSQQIVVSWNDTKELHCDRATGSRFFKLIATAAERGAGGVTQSQRRRAPRGG